MFILECPRYTLLPGEPPMELETDNDDFNEGVNDVGCSTIQISDTED